MGHATHFRHLHSKRFSILNPMSFGPCNVSLKIRESTETPTPQSGSSLGSVRVHCLTLPYIPRSMKCDSWASYMARTFASPHLDREPKVTVTTIIFNHKLFIIPATCVDPLTWWWIHGNQYPNVTFITKQILGIIRSHIQTNYMCLVLSVC